MACALGSGAAAAVLAVTAACAQGAVPVRIECRLSVPAQRAVGEPVELRLELHNRGSAPVDVLIWATPFERAWFAPYVDVLRGDTPLRYGGASVKRGEPRAADYVHLAPGESRGAAIDLAPVFDLSQAGRYRVLPKIVLHDVAASGEAPRPRERHAGFTPACNGAAFELR